MKSGKDTRPYEMKARARTVARNERRILEAVAALWQEVPILEITLEAVAERAGVSVRTILRKHGSKEGLFQASIENDAAGIMGNRDKAPVGDVEEALRILFTDYENYGDANIRTLAMEEELEVARELLKSGRQYHRRWCARVFAPHLPEPSEPEYEFRLLAFIAATDIYTWKLLRRDQGKTKEETVKVMKLLLEGLFGRGE